MSTTPAALSIGALLSDVASLTVDSASFPDSQTSVTGYLCLQSNDPADPVHLIRITAIKQ